MTTLLGCTLLTRDKLPVRWTFIILSYLLLEWVYNQHLLLLLDYAAIAPQQFEWTEIFGKVIAAIGLNLVFIHFYKNPGIIKFALGVALTYIMLSWIFTQIIESFPDEFLHSSYYGVMQRKKVVEGVDTEQILSFTKNTPWHIRPLVLSQYYLTLQDQQWSVLESRLRSPIEKRMNAALKDKKLLWAKYQQAETGRQYAESDWEGYKEAMRKYTYYRQNPRHAKRAYDTFLSRVGAEPGLTFEEFIEKKAVKYHNFLRSTIVEGNSDIELKPIYGKDLPLRLSETHFYRYLDATLLNIKTTVAPTTNEIRENKISKNAVALMVIPPLSLGLSLISITINLISLVCTWVIIFLPRDKVRLRACALVCSIAFIGVSMAYASEPHAARIDPYWAQLDVAFEQNHGVLWAAMSIPMRLESLLCITERPVGWIGKGMSMLYKSNIVQGKIN